MDTEHALIASKEFQCIGDDMPKIKISNEEIIELKKALFIVSTMEIKLKLEDYGGRINWEVIDKFLKKVDKL